MAKRPLPAPEPTSDYLSRTSLEYSRYILDHRGIPSWDGLKSVQRIALHLIRSTPGKIKTSAFSGAMVESELYNHGSVNAADAVSRLAGPYTNNRTLILGEGAFGTRSNPGKFSDPRYTYVKRSPFAERVLYMDHEIVPQMENADGSRLMPASFLPLIPLVLLNGIRGIAVGWSTMILPRSLDDIVAGTLEYLRTGTITTRLYPKYENYNVRVTKGDGSGRYVVSGRFERVGPNSIRISEIPMETQTEFFTLKNYRKILIALEQEGTISDYSDRSKSQIDITVEFPEGRAAYTEIIDGEKVKHPEVRALKQISDDEIMKLLRLRSVMSERLVVLGPPSDPGVRQFETAQELIKRFVDWRLGWFKPRYERRARIDSEEELFQRCIMAVYDGKVPDGIPKLADKTALKAEIGSAITRAKLDLREDIVERLAMLPGYRWTKEGRAEAEQAASAAKRSQQENLAIAKSPTRQKRVYGEELEQIGKV